MKDGVSRSSSALSPIIFPSSIAYKLSFIFFGFVSFFGALSFFCSIFGFGNALPADRTFSVSNPVARTVILS